VTTGYGASGILYGRDGRARRSASFSENALPETRHERQRELSHQRVRASAFSAVLRSIKRNGNEARLDYANLAQRLHSMLAAGLSPTEAVNAIVKQAAPDEAQVLSQLMRSLGAGRPLSEGVAALPGAPPLLVELLRASERTSDLPSALAEYAKYTAAAGEFRHRIFSAAIYPALLVVVGLGVVAFLLLVVMPRFSGVYAGLSGPLPWAVQFMLGWSRWAKEYGLLTLGALLLLGMGFVALVVQPSFRARALDRMAQAGRIGELWREHHLARLYRLLAMLLRGGLTFPAALRLAGGVLPGALAQAGRRAEEDVLRGASPAAAFQTAGLATPVSAPLLRAAERTGQMAAMLRQAAEYHEQNVVRSVEKLMKTAEPLLMTIIGVAIGGIVVLMYMPVFELAQALR
jgi:general secretion pathway protein F